MRTVDYLLSGQGLAGTVLAYTLQRQGLRVCVADGGTLPSASAVAAGIFNPVTGRRPTKTWQADVLFPFLHQFYRRLEESLDEHFFYPTPLYRPFQSVEEQNTSLALTASPELSDYLSDASPELPLADFIHCERGGLTTKHSGYLAVDGLLTSCRRHLSQQHALVNENVAWSDVSIRPDGVEWKGIRARKLISCEGIHAAKNPYFNWLPFRPVKGELLTIELPTRVPDCMVKGGVYLVPTGMRTAKIGATYDRNEVNWEVTAQSRAEMTATLNQWLKPSYGVIGQQAGIRPATPDRRPLLGLHPTHPSLGVFNGMGSKGVSLAPYYAHHFYEFLEAGKELAAAVNINRYLSLYFNKNL